VGRVRMKSSIFHRNSLPKVLVGCHQPSRILSYFREHGLVYLCVNRKRDKESLTRRGQERECWRKPRRKNDRFMHLYRVK